MTEFEPMSVQCKNFVFLMIQLKGIVLPRIRVNSFLETRDRMGEATEVEKRKIGAP